MLKNQPKGGRVRTNYVLIDYESVQPEALAVLNQEHFKVIVFVGANQSKLSFDNAAALQSMGERGSYIKISGNGPNALDFHIAFYIGEIASREPDAFFHIVSKDKGFDPLIAHLKARKILAGRSKDVADIPIVKAANSKTPEQKLEVILTKLHQMANSKPKGLKTLTSRISATFPTPLTEEEVAPLIQEMERRGWLTVTGTKISYSLPAA